MEWSHADFAPHMEQRYCFRDHKIAIIAISAYLKKNNLCHTTYIFKVYMNYLTTFDYKKYFEGEYIKAVLFNILSNVPAIGRYGSFIYLLVPKTMLPLRVQIEVCMAPFHVRRKFCIAAFQVQSKFEVFAPHIEGSNADCFRDYKKAIIAISAN